MVFVKIRENEETGKTEYYCPVCRRWTSGQLWDGTGYTQVICDGCDLTLNDDYFGHKEMDSNDKN
ncbi:MAG: hypothetical protein H6631_20620 [Anaerolineaceae bacterium]|nr:hypothetical protein [Anaerolineaceae bacterium]